MSVCTWCVCVWIYCTRKKKITFCYLSPFCHFLLPNSNMSQIHRQFNSSCLFLDSRYFIRFSLFLEWGANLTPWSPWTIAAMPSVCNSLPLISLELIKYIAFLLQASRWVWVDDLHITDGQLGLPGSWVGFGAGMKKPWPMHHAVLGLELFCCSVDSRPAFDVSAGWLLKKGN